MLTTSRCPSASVAAFLSDLPDPKQNTFRAGVRDAFVGGPFVHSQLMGGGKKHTQIYRNYTANMPDVIHLRLYISRIRLLKP